MLFQEKLVYTGHTYPYLPPTNLPWFLYQWAITFTQLFIDNAGYQFSAPYWLGEFGVGRSDTENWQKLLRLLEENDSDFSYWSVDGYKRPGKEETFGLLEDDYQTVKFEWKLEQLQRLMPILDGNSTPIRHKNVFLYPVLLLFQLVLEVTSNLYELVHSSFCCFLMICHYPGAWRAKHGSATVN